MKMSDPYADCAKRTWSRAFNAWSWAFLTIAATDSMCPFIASAQEVTGANVKYVEVGVLGKAGRENTKRGDYRMIEPGVWQYKEAPFTGYQTITLHYAEQSRDPWSVYLEPIDGGLGRGGSHQNFPKIGRGSNINTAVQIDLYRKQILFKGSSDTLHDVLTSSSTPPDVVNGQNVALVKYRWIGGGSQGYFRNDNGTGWEQIEGGERKAIYFQTSRDPWSVFLTDGKTQRLRLDLYFMQVYIGEGESAKPIYSIDFVQDNRRIPVKEEKPAPSRPKSNGFANHPLVDAEGYPKHDIKHTGDISFTPTIRHHDNYGWTIPDDATFRKFFVFNASNELFTKLRNQTLLLPNVSTSAGGHWMMVNNVNNLNGTETATFAGESSITISREFSAEVSVGYNASAMLAVAPLGVGAEITIGQSIEFTAGVAVGQEWTKGVAVEFPVPAGKFAQGWQQRMIINSKFHTARMFERPSSGPRNNEDQHWFSTTAVTSGEDLFLVTMAESYGSIFFPNEYADLRARALIRSNDKYLGLLNALKDSKQEGYGTKYEFLKAIFSYEGFKSIGLVEKSYELPTPEYYVSLRGPR